MTRHSMGCSSTGFGILLATAVLSMMATTATPGAAQVSPNAAPGFRAEGTYDFSSIDQVAIFNGALSLQIPIGSSYPVDGGMSWSLGLQYHSTLWDQRVLKGPTCPLVIRPKRLHNAGLGWRLALDTMIAPLGPWNTTFHWLYVSSDGAEHVYTPSFISRTARIREIPLSPEVN
jgi:hypothetical protein